MAPPDREPYLLRLSPLFVDLGGTGGVVPVALEAEAAPRSGSWRRVAQRAPPPHRSQMPLRSCEEDGEKEMAAAVWDCWCRENVRVKETYVFG